MPTESKQKRPKARAASEKLTAEFIDVLRTKELRQEANRKICTLSVRMPARTKQLLDNVASAYSVKKTDIVVTLFDMFLSSVPQHGWGPDLFKRSVGRE